MNNFRGQYRWQKKFQSEVKEIISKNLSKMVSVNVASKYKDMNEGTDYVINIDGIDVTVRTRKHSFFVKYCDLTIRSKTQYDNKTELDKIREGYVDWFLYVWVDDSESYIEHWALLDINMIRDKKLLVNPNYKSNGDGTEFAWIPMLKLEENRCIVAKNFEIPKKGKQRNPFDDKQIRFK